MVPIGGQWNCLSYGEKTKVSGNLKQILEPKKTCKVGAVGGSGGVSQ